MSKKDKEVKQKSNAPKLIGAIVAMILAILVITGGILCISYKQTPEQLFTMMVGKDDDILTTGYWESDKAPGFEAYRFDEDGTFNQYYFSVIFNGRYEIKGNKIYTTNPTTQKDAVYTFKITEDKLVLTTIEVDGKEAEEKEVLVYNHVEELNQTSFSDFIGNYVQDKNEEETTLGEIEE